MEENTSVNSRICSAVRFYDLTSLQFLLLEGHRIDFQDEIGSTPLHLALTHCNYSENHECVNILLKHPTCPVNVQNNDGRTCLHLACKKRLPEHLIKGFLDKGADPNIADIDLRTPIHIECQNGNLNMVKLLRKYGADLNAQNKFNNTPLHCAVQAGAKHIVRYLLENNVDTSVKGSLGYNPFMWAIYSDEQEIVDMLLPFTSDLTAVGKGNDNAFDLAIEFKNMKVIETLIDKAPEMILSKIEILLTRRLCAESHLAQLNLILRTPNLGSVLKDVKGIFSHIFNSMCHSREFYFEIHKSSFVFIVDRLIHFEVKLDHNDLITFMNFFKYCPYRKQLLQTVALTLDLNLDIRDIGFAFVIHPEFGIFFLQNCVVPLNCCIYEELKVPKKDVDNLKYLFPLFTPKCLKAYKMYVRNKYKIKQFQKHLSVKVRSLKEISRDVARYHIHETYRNLDNGNHKLTDFSNFVKSLHVPNVVKDILLFKASINDMS